MSKACKATLGLAMIVLLAGPALAQDQPRQGRGGAGRGGPGMMGGGGGLAFLLQNEGVQKELKLDKDGLAKASEAAKKVADAHQGDFAKVQELDVAERGAKMGEIRAAVNAEVLTALGSILKPEQLKRLKQIELQTQGARAFTNAEVQKSLKLNNDQIEKIKTINDDARAEMQSLFSSGGGGRGNPANFEKMQAMRKETLTKIENVLTDEQKKTWKDMTGDPFQLQMQPRQRRNANG
jgi:hypothetical protein